MLILRDTHLIEEAKNFSSSLSSTGLLMIHNTKSRGHHDVSELTRGKNIHNPLLYVLERHIEARGDDSTLVNTSNELYNNLAVAVIVKHSEIPNVAILLHCLEELDDHLGARAQEHLPLTTLLSVTNRL